MFFRFALTLAILLLAVAGVDAATLNGHITPPRGTSAEGATILLWDRLPELTDDDATPLATAHTNARGDFKIEITTQSLALNIEVIGEGMRRARFGITQQMLTQANAQATFRTEQGGSAEITLRDGETGLPVSGALIGPITLDADAARDAMERTYPFFVKADDSGKAQIAGLIPGANYVGCVHAPTHERRMLRFAAGVSREESLRRGGGAFSGKATGSRTLRAHKGIVVILTGGPDSFDIRKACDDAGAFAFDALPAGEYRLMATLPNDGGNGRPIPLMLKRDARIDNIMLAVNEGISVAGMAQDVETKLPLAGVRVSIRGQATATSASGAFRFDRVEGPWPATVGASLDGYDVENEEEESSTPREVNGFAMEDVTDMVIALRRRRVIDIVPEWPSSIPMEERRILGTLMGPFKDDGTSGGSMALPVQQRTLVPLKKSGLFVFYARSASGIASDLVPLRVSQADTTITLPVNMDKGAILRGSLGYLEDDAATPTYSVVLRTQFDRASIVWMTIQQKPGDRTFAQDALPPGTFTAEFVDPNNNVLLSKTIELKRGEATELHEKIARGNVFAGKVVDPNGVPQGEIELELFGRDRVKTMTKQDGTFRFDNLKGDVIEELHVNHHQWSSEPITKITLPNEDYTITLKPRGVINVDVRASAGELERAFVVLMQGSQRTSSIAANQWYYDEAKREALLGNARGTISGAPSGRYRVALQAGETWSVSPAFDWEGDKNGANKTIEMSAGEKGTIVATFKDFDDESLAALDVSLVNTSLPASASAEFPATTRKDGRIDFIGIPTGEYLLVVSRSTGEFFSSTNISLEANETKTIAIDFKGDLATFSGVVRFASTDGEPIAGVEVKIYYGDIPEPPQLAVTKTDAQGRFSFDLLQGGRPYLLMLSNGEKAKQVMTGKLDAENPAEQIIVWNKPTRVRFVIAPELLSKLQGQSIASIGITEAQGMSSTSIALDQLNSEQSLDPGTYFARAGEISLGTFNLVAADRTLDITLTEESAP